MRKMIWNGATGLAFYQEVPEVIIPPLEPYWLDVTAPSFWDDVSDPVEWDGNNILPWTTYGVSNVPAWRYTYPTNGVFTVDTAPWVQGLTASRFRLTMSRNDNFLINSIFFIFDTEGSWILGSDYWAESFPVPTFFSEGGDDFMQLDFEISFYGSDIKRFTIDTGTSSGDTYITKMELLVNP